MDNSETITMLEWCAGYGGIGLGLKKVFGERLRCLAYCELEGFAQANLIGKMEAGLLDVAPIWSDAKTFPNEEFHGLVDILVAGYPCQPFSAAGKRKGTDDPRHLWPHILRAVGIIRPRLCYFENVEGHISLGLSTVISDLEEIGYKVAAGIFSAAEVGAPHQRRRVFILAQCIYTGSQRRLRKWEDTERESIHGHAGCGGTGIQGDGVARQAWPARPGQPQYQWEPPRVVADARRDGGERRSGVGEVRAGDAGAQGESQGGSGEGTDEAGERAQSEPVCSGAEPAVGQCDIDGQAESKVGRDFARSLHGVDLSELSGLSHQELAEIYEWMVKSDNRTDELRLLGNGVVVAVAEKAFRVLMQQLYR